MKQVIRLCLILASSVPCWAQSNHQVSPSAPTAQIEGAIDPNADCVLGVSPSDAKAVQQLQHNVRAISSLNTPTTKAKYEFEVNRIISTAALSEAAKIALIARDRYESLGHAHVWDSKHMYFAYFFVTERQQACEQARRFVETSSKTDIDQSLYAAVSTTEQDDMIQTCIDNDNPEESAKTLEAMVKQFLAAHNVDRHGMSDAEVAALQLYGMSDYSYFRKINSDLRSGAGSACRDVIVAALNKLPNYVGMVVRKGWVPSSIKVGDVFSDKGFLSTAWQPRLRGPFTKPNMFIYSKTCKLVEDFMPLEEHEVLCKPGTRFRVTGVAGDQVTMEEI